HQPGVAQQVDAQRVARRLVVVVPAQLNRAAPIVGGLPGRAPERLPVVAVGRVVGGVLLHDVHPATGLVVDVGEEGGGLLLPDRVASGGGEAREGTQGGGQRAVAVERVPAREHRVELRLAHDEVPDGSSGAVVAGVGLPVPGADDRVVARVGVLGDVRPAVGVTHDVTGVVPPPGHPAGIAGAGGGGGGGGGGGEEHGGTAGEDQGGGH